MEREPITWGYARASLAKQEKSPAHQIDLFDQRMARGDLPPLVVRSEHASAIRKRWYERPEFAKILAQAQRGDCLLVWRLDRIDRMGFPLIAAIEKLRSMGVRILSWEDRSGAELDLATAAGRAYVHLRAIQTDMWSETHANATKEAHDYRKKRGLAYNQYRIGFKRTIVDGEKMDVWDKREIAQIKEIVARKRTGEAFASIATDFGIRKERTAMGKLWAPPKQNGGYVADRLKRAYYYEQFLARIGLELGSEEAKKYKAPTSPGTRKNRVPKPLTIPKPKKPPAPKKPKKQPWWIIQFGSIEQRVRGRVSPDGILKWVDPNGFRGRTVPGKYRRLE